MSNEGVPEERRMLGGTVDLVDALKNAPTSEGGGREQGRSHDR